MASSGRRALDRGTSVDDSNLAGHAAVLDSASAAMETAAAAGDAYVLSASTPEGKRPSQSFKDGDVDDADVSILAVSVETPVPIEVGHALHDWNPETAENMTHMWQRQDISTKLAFRKRHGYHCSSCHLWVEGGTGSEPPMYHACRPTYTRLSEYPPAEPPLTIHHWVRGHFEKNRTCNQCEKPLSGKKVGFHADGYRCAWCKRFIHQHCLAAMKGAWGHCDLGLYELICLGSADILLHPSPDDGDLPQVDDVDMYARNMNRHYELTSSNNPPRTGRRQSEPFVLNQSNRSFSSGSLMPRRPTSDRTLGTRRGEGQQDEGLGEIGDMLLGCDSTAVARMTEEQRRNLQVSLRRASERRMTAHAHVEAKQRAVGAATAATRPLQFTVVPARQCHPLLVFVNPKSGGNQGVKLMQQLLWYLNPRQVFNLLAKTDDGKVAGPRPGLEHYKDVDNLRILVCGGDGTIGWVLSVLDEMGLSDRRIPIGTVPLGTGNDMSRALKFGGGYEGESLKKIFSQLLASVMIRLDRWSLLFAPTPDEDGSINASCPPDVPLTRDIPLSVFNNYFSIGSDAWAALGFHLARERDPNKFSSRIHNKAFYGIQGAKDIFQRKFKNLSTMLELTCDGKDYTETLKRKGLEAVAFLNIYSYAAGTRPWGTKTAVDAFQPPRMDDGLIEVVGFESALAIAKGVMRVGHAFRICQCREANLVIKQPLPVQVDGEPCMLAAGTLRVAFKNQATMLVRPKGRFKRDLENHRADLAFPLVQMAEMADDDDDDEAEGGGRARRPRSSQIMPLTLTEANRISLRSPRVCESEEPFEIRVRGQFSRGASTDDSAAGSNAPTPARTSLSSVVGAAMDNPNRVSPNPNRGSPNPNSNGEKAASVASGLAGSVASAVAGAGLVPLAASPLSASSMRMGDLSMGSSSAAAVASEGGETIPASGGIDSGSEGTNSRRHSRLILDDDASDDSDDSVLQPVALYLVPLADFDRTGTLQPLGTALLPVQHSLAACRHYLTQALGVSFRRRHGWRFLQYTVEYTGSAEGEGVYLAVKREEEDTMTPEHFMRQAGGACRGIVVCCLGKAAEPIQALLDAARAGEKSQVEALVSTGIHPNNSDPSGTTALHVAAYANRLTIVLYLLLDARANPNAMDVCGRTPLHYAAEHGLLSICQALVRSGAAADMSDRTGMTPLQLAKRAGHDNVAAAIVSGAADAVPEDREVRPASADTPPAANNGSGSDGESFV